MVADWTCRATTSQAGATEESIAAETRPSPSALAAMGRGAPSRAPRRTAEDAGLDGSSSRDSASMAILRRAGAVDLNTHVALPGYARQGIDELPSSTDRTRRDDAGSLDSPGERGG